MPSLVLAGTISLTTSVTTDVLSKNQGQIQVSLSNSGNEAAYNVQLSLVTDYFSSDPVHVGTLDVNKPFKTNITFSANQELKEGNYPVVLLTEYTDANGYPFSSVSPVTLTYKNPYSSRINWNFTIIEISGKKPKNLVLNLKNMDQVSHDINVRLILPNELSSDVGQNNITLGSKEEKTITFKVSNFAGLEGSNYVVLASIEYEGDHHYSSLASGMVKIIESKDFFRPDKWVIISAIGVLILVFIIYQFKNKKIEFKFTKNKKWSNEKED